VEGEAEGDALGLTLELEEGEAEGDAFGLVLGLAEGSGTVGLVLGLVEGKSEGETVGLALGEADSPIVFQSILKTVSLFSKLHSAISASHVQNRLPWLRSLN